MEGGEAPGSVRVDRWLVASRAFKTRAAAHEACEAGHVKVNGASASPARPLRVGDTVDALLARGRVTWVVRALEVRRGPAALARELYDDRTPPREPEPPVFLERDRGAGRPTKREARLLRKLRGW